ncbi:MULTISPECIES: hybrid sensor histidine kinase/response regulator [Phenylobacterium]|uniref:histidine kinase n=1 Tax=Phenylobacterium koreense TaxID=266125 RepID=A0ABV2EEI6_9CAUL
MSARNGRIHYLALGGCLAALFMLSTAFSLVLTREGEGIATVWLGGGVLAAGFLMLPRRWSLGLGALCWTFQFGCNLVLGNSLVHALTFPILTIGEAAFTAWLAVKVCGPALRLTTLSRLARLIGLAVAPATSLSALLAADVLTLYGHSFDTVLANWFYGHALGMVIVLPAILLAARPGLMREFQRPAIEELALYALVAASGVIAFTPMRFPLVLLFFPAMTLVAFRLGPRGAAIAALIMGVTASIMVVQAPLAEGVSWSVMERTRAMQFLVALCFFTSLTTAMAIFEQKRMKRLWIGRTRAARASQDRALAAGKAKTEFLATMSHEIRTPMTSIVGFTEVLLTREDLPEHARRQLSLIDRAGASLLSVVNDILDFSKVEAGEVTLNPVPTVPRALVQETLAIVAEAAKLKGLDLRLSFIGPVDRTVMIDELRVRQILLNLLSNAIKFTDHGRVSLEAQAIAQGDHMALRFRVSDTGVGLTPDRAARLFKRFSQGDASVSRTHGGTGLGLAICKGLVELMGGHIAVEPPSGAGAVFGIEIPAPVADAQTQAAPESPVQPLAAKVLLVDDHPANRELAATVLDILGCEVTLAEDGEEAVTAAASRAFDLILMDVHMPRMDGLQASRAIRALGGENATLPILAMSADVMPEMEAACLEAGMNATVGKPIQIPALHAALARWLGRDASAIAA